VYYRWLYSKIFIRFVCILGLVYTHAFPCSANWEGLKPTNKPTTCISVSNIILQLKKKNLGIPGENVANYRIGAGTMKCGENIF
jgi:hypothetical protein